MFQSEFSMNLSNYLIKLADSNFKTFTSENKPTFWLIKFLALFEFCFTFDNLWKKIHSEKLLAILKKPGEIVTRSGF